MNMNIQTSEINSRNNNFWDQQYHLLQTRMANAAIRETAFEMLSSETLRRIPGVLQTSVERALEQAENAQQRFSAQFAKRGGKAKKSDALSLLIIDIVTKRRNISAAELYSALQSCQHPGIIQDIDQEAIYFTNHNNKTKVVKTTALKDRLTRAKKTLVAQSR